MRTLNWLLISAVVGASGCSPTYLEDLKTPALVWTQSTGLCSKILAVDANSTVWTNTGCEDGRPELDEVRTATQAQADDLWTKFDALLPFDQGATLESCAGHVLNGFDRWEGQSRSGASACGGTQYDDVSSLPDAFMPLADALRSLE